MVATINQANKVLLRDWKDIYLWCPTGALASNFSRWLVPLGNTCLLHLYLYLFWWDSYLKVTLVYVSISTFSTLPTYSIPLGYVHKFCMMCLHVQFLEDMCTNYVFWLCLIGVWFVSAYSIPVRYVHKSPWCFDPRGCLGWRIHWGWWKTPWGVWSIEKLLTHGGAALVCSLLGMVTCWEVCWWLWPMRKSLVMHGPLGKILLFLHGSLGNLCLFYPRGGLVYSIGKFPHNSRGVAFMPWSHRRVLPWYCNLGNLWSVEGCFGYFPFIGDAFKGLCVLYPTKGIFVASVHSWIFPFHFPPFENPLGTFEDFFLSFFFFFLIFNFSY